MAKKSGGTFSRRGPDILTEELAMILIGKDTFEFKPLFTKVYTNLRARNPRPTSCRFPWTRRCRRPWSSRRWRYEDGNLRVRPLRGAKAARPRPAALVRRMQPQTGNRDAPGADQADPHQLGAGSALRRGFPQVNRIALGIGQRREAAVGDRFRR